MDPDWSKHSPLIVFELAAAPAQSIFVICRPACNDMQICIITSSAAFAMWSVTRIIVLSVLVASVVGCSKEIEHGPKKYPGLDISTQSVTGSGKPLIGRRVVVMAGPRIYDLSVSGTVEGLMQLPEVKEFFESFNIRD